MRFRLYPFRFTFRAISVLRLPVGQAANVLRGAFGTMFRRVACRQQCAQSGSCLHPTQCAYARLFEPSGLIRQAGPSGFANWPRPFLFRAGHLDEHAVMPGEKFFFDLHLFDSEQLSETLDSFERTFRLLGEEGFGPARTKAELVHVSPLASPSLELDLAPLTQTLTHLRVEFLTPTELKSGDVVTAVPEFAILAARIRDRISTLRQLYSHEGPLPIDFRSFSGRASLIRITESDLHTVAIERRSSRTKQVHSIGGFVGSVTYQGPHLNEFVPFITAAQWTGVGRHTVWGNGHVRVLLHAH